MPITKYESLLARNEWKERRLEILNRDNYTCVACGEKRLILHVHHLRYDKSLFPWEYPSKDLQTLCSICHNEVHNKTRTSKGDGFFLKVYPMFFENMLQLLREDHGAIRLAFYILKKAMDLPIDSDNRIIMLNSEIKKALNISLSTAIRYIRVMIKAGLIEKEIMSVYKINPEMVYKGNLVKYYQKEMEKK